MKWPTRRLDEISSINPRLGRAPSQNDRVSFVPMAAVSEQTLAIEDEEDRVFKEVAKGYTQFRRGDIIIAKITPCFQNGKMAHAVNLKHEVGIGSTEFHVFRPGNQLDGAYLFHLLLAPVVKARGVGRMKGAAGQRRVPEDYFASLTIHLPPLAEQNRIAGILDEADALRAKRRESLAQLDTLLQSTFLDMFGDPATNPMGWEQSPLGKLCEVGSSKRVFVNELVEEGVPFYRGTEVGSLGEGEAITPTLFITHDHYQQLKCHSGVPRPGDLLLPSICPDGRIFIVRDDKPFYFKDGRVLWIKAGDSGINSTFLRYHLKAVFFTDYSKIASGTTFAELKIFALKDLVVHVPPRDEQNRFTKFVDSIEGQRARMRAHLAELDALFASLQSRAFNGEL